MTWQVPKYFGGINTVSCTDEYVKNIFQCLIIFKHLGKGLEKDFLVETILRRNKSKVLTPTNGCKIESNAWFRLTHWQRKRFRYIVLTYCELCLQHSSCDPSQESINIALPCISLAPGFLFCWINTTTTALITLLNENSKRCIKGETKEYHFPLGNC